MVVHRKPLQDGEFLPFELDLAQRRVLLLRLTEAQRASAPFLDERARPASAEAVWLPLQDVVEEGRASPSLGACWIFHIGHCGSTLLSRLLQSWPHLQVLREPLPLRSLAAAVCQGVLSGREAATLGDVMVRLWARAPGLLQTTLVKATSSCNMLAGPLLSMRKEDRAILLAMPLRSYLATLLKSASSIRDALAAADERMMFLQDVLPASSAMALPKSAGEICAMGWLAEQVRFEALSTASERIKRMDFEHLLANPRSALANAVEHLQLDKAHLDAALASPWWHRYAKAGDHAYGVEDRRHDQALALARFADEIARGVAWVRDASPRHAS